MDVGVRKRKNVQLQTAEEEKRPKAKKEGGHHGLYVCLSSVCLLPLSPPWWTTNTRSGKQSRHRRVVGLSSERQPAGGRGGPSMSDQATGERERERKRERGTVSINVRRYLHADAPMPSKVLSLSRPFLDQSGRQPLRVRPFTSGASSSGPIVYAAMGLCPA